MEHIRLTGPPEGLYFIRDNISNVHENEIIGLLDDILWPFVKKCAMQKVWQKLDENHVERVLRKTGA